MRYDVIVIGGGPSGIFAAISAKRTGAKVVLIEKNDKLGKKMLISGGGRCNLSNNGPIDFLIKNTPGNGKFLYSAFHQFSNNDLIQFFEKDLGIQTKVEDNGRVFPKSDRSKTLIEALTKHIVEQGIDILYHTSVEEIVTKEDRVTGVKIREKDQIQINEVEGNVVVLATGGISFPKTGSTGDGYKFAKGLGHTVKDLFPTSVPILSNDKIIRNKLLQGISLRNIKISLIDQNGKLVKAEKGDLLFTHFGISGPAALRLSRDVALREKNKDNYNLKVEIDIIPENKETEILENIERMIEDNPQKTVFNGLKGLLPDKLLHVVLSNLDNVETKKMVELGKKRLNKLVHHIKHFSLTISGTRSIQEAFVTGGGISIREIDPKTLSSKKWKGLYIVGELLDIDAFTGGFNMQAAFSMGYVAGQAAGNYSQNK